MRAVPVGADEDAVQHVIGHAKVVGPKFETAPVPVDPAIAGAAHDAALWELGQRGLNQRTLVGVGWGCWVGLLERGLLLDGVVYRA